MYQEDKTDWKKELESFKKMNDLFKQEQKVEQDNFCPTCGKRLWPTPHGPQPCHPLDWEIIGGRTIPGIYNDGNGFFMAVD